MYHNLKVCFHFTVAHDLMTSMTMPYVHLPAAWWAFLVVMVQCQPSYLHTVICNIQSKQRWCTQHLHSEVEQIYMPTVFSVCYEISTIIIFHFPSHLPHIINLVFIIDCLFQPPTTLVWFTLDWISTFGRERRGVTLNHSQPWMKCSWRESSLSAAVTAACLIGPSPLHWHDMMGDDTQQQHIGLRC